MIENNHGRQEIQESYVISEMEWLQERDKWKNLASIGLLKNSYIQNNEKKVVLRYYISSKKLTALQLIYYARNEWKIESMYWLLNVNLKEDVTTLSEQNAQETLIS